MSPVPKKSRLDVSEDSRAATDDGSPSGFIRYEVAVSDITSIGIYSPTIEVLGMSWRLRVKKGHYYLAIFLHHRTSDCDMWSIDASIDFSLINIDGVNHQVRKLLDTYNHKCENLGFPGFIKWDEVINEEKGFIEDDKIIVEARFTLSKIVGIRTISPVDFSISNELFRDVALVINGEKVHVSKQILAIYSSHFKALFYGEDGDCDKKEIEIQDIDRKEFIEMLKFLYPSYAKISDVNAEYLLKLSDRFQIKKILDQVEKFLINSSKFNVLTKLNLSDKYKLVTLQEHCLSTYKIIKDITDLQSTVEYDALSKNAKVTLLEKIMKLSKNSAQPHLNECEDSIASDGSPSGFIRFEVAISDITQAGIYSPVIKVLGLPWNLIVRKFRDSLKVGLCHRTSDSDMWSIDAAIEFVLINVDNENNVDIKSNDTFNHKRVALGTTFSKVENAFNEDKGFVNDGKITVECRFILSNIIGIRINAHVDFTDSKEPFHDVALLIEGQKIYISKQILAIHSPVFNVMFFDDFAEKNKEVIELKDVDREVFIDMLNLIYPSYQKITDDNVEPLLQLADRFQIKSIIDQAEQFIIDSTKLNIPAKLNLSEQYRLVTLQEFCLNTFKTMKEITDLKTIDGFEKLSKNMKGTLLMKIVKLS